jgi:hypothetical protein
MVEISDYLVPDMNDDQLNRRFKQINDRIDKLIPKPITKPTKRWRFTLDRWLILATLLVAVFAWWQPQWAGSSQRAADDHIDTRIASTVGKDVRTIKENMSRRSGEATKCAIYKLLFRFLDRQDTAPRGAANRAAMACHIRKITNDWMICLAASHVIHEVREAFLTN